MNEHESDVIEEVIELLRGITEKSGPFSRDRLEHAANVIEAMSDKAERALELLGAGHE
jgi:hypothetical protein